MTSDSTFTQTYHRKVFICLLIAAAVAIAGIILQKEETPTEKHIDENGTYHIESFQDLRDFASYANDGHEDLNAVLDSDIDAEKKMVFVKDYRGSFDGQGHTVSNTSAALFIRLHETALVENLFIADAEIYFDEIGMGGIAYKNEGIIRNCQVSGKVEGSNYVGGIAALNFGTIEACENHADVTSSQTGETFQYESTYDGYGAGGIAGACYSPKDIGEDAADPSVPTAIISCSNYGNVTAKVTAGGICSYLDDRTNGGAPNLSVAELVETTDFADISGSSSAQKEPIHFSMADCRNYGIVIVEERFNYDRSVVSSVAGICPDVHGGDLYHCANLGCVMFSENAPEVSESGFVYNYTPYAITDTMGYSSAISHVYDCVNLKGTIARTMRDESVMEISEDELVLWEEGKLDYRSNSWRFQLDEAVRLCQSEPIDVENTKHAFILALPEGFSVEEKWVQGSCYALRIYVKPQDFEKLPDSLRTEGMTDYEAWLFHKTADVDGAFRETVGSDAQSGNVRVSWQDQKFISEVYDTMMNIHSLRICPLNLPMSACYTEADYSGKRIFMRCGIPYNRLYSYGREGDLVLGNLLSMPLLGNPEDGLHAEWVFLFCSQHDNRHPDASFVNAIEDSFYPLDGSESLFQVEYGDTLTSLALRYTGDSANYQMLAQINHIQDPDCIKAGDLLLVPDRASYEKRAGKIDALWFDDPYQTAK